MTGRRTQVRAVLFAKDLNQVAMFYERALGMTRQTADDVFVVLEQDGFELIVHQIPQQIAAGIEISVPPARREAGALRLDYPVDDLARCRQLAISLGGSIDESPPAWADDGTKFFLGYDPEGNVFGVSQQPA